MTFEQEIEDLLAEGIEGARRREADTFDKLAGNGTRDLVLFGAGNLGRRTLTGLRKAGIEPLGFIDNNKELWGKDLDGLYVLSPAEGAKLYGNHATFVVTIWRGEGRERMPERMAQLHQLGCRTVVPFLPLYWKLAGSLLPHYALDLPHCVHLQGDRVRQGFRLMADDASRREYLAQLRFRLLGDFACLPDPVEGAIYFREDMFALGRAETLVDCGAFDGDTLSLFLEKTGGMFKRAIALEPDPANSEKLVERVSLLPPELRRRISLYQVATGEANGRVFMDVGRGPASHVGSGELEVECVSLDSLLGSTSVSFIKMDIEGSELATLAGARKLIQENVPILAICAYHRQDDLWNIPLFIHGVNSRYCFHLRPHLLEGWDLVCYAVPPERVMR
jgi:FkbM family methyltransferase